MSMANVIRYTNYNSTGILGLEELPSHWTVKRIKYLFDIGRGRVISQEELQAEGIYPVYSSQTKNNGCLGYINTFDFDCRQITWTTDGANAGTVFLRNGKHNCTNVCGTLQLKSNETFLKFTMYCLQYVNQFHKRPDTNGAKIMNNEMAEISIPLPLFNEQSQIANFLDHETAKIDTLIDKQQQLIKLLKEKRQAVISHVVTRGLNPDAPMKDSGVEWIGRIPQHWSVAEVRRFTEEHRQGYYSEKGYSQTGHRVVRITDILNNNAIDVSDSPFFVMDLENKSRYELKKGDFLFQRTGSHKKIGIFNSDEPSVYASFLIRFRFCGNLNHNYILNFFNSTSYKNQLNEQIHGGVNPNIHAENIKILKYVSLRFHLKMSRSQ